jgi:hypothetical protein
MKKNKPKKIKMKRLVDRVKDDGQYINMGDLKVIPKYHQRYLTLSTRITVLDFRKFETIHKRMGMTKADVIRRWIKSFIKGYEEKYGEIKYE